MILLKMNTETGIKPRQSVNITTLAVHGVSRSRTRLKQLSTEELMLLNCGVGEDS